MESKYFTYSKKFNESELFKVEVHDEFVVFETRFGSHEVSKYHSTFIHDFTISSKMEKTDVVVDNLTPDIVKENEIIEVTTTNTSNELIMFDKLNVKIRKYSNIAKKHQKELKVYVVSKQSVISNDFNPDEDWLEDMIYRFDVACKLKQYVFDNHNLDLWLSENKRKIERTLHSVLMNAYVVKPQDDFELSLDVDLPEYHPDLLKYFIDECSESFQNFKIDPHNYVNDYLVNGTRHDYKRIIPVSLILPTSYDGRFDQRTELLHCHIKDVELTNHQIKFIKFATESIKIEHDKDFEYKIAIEEVEVPPKRKKSMYKFEVNLTNDERVNLGMFGVQAKKLIKSKNELILAKRRKDKESFSFDAPIDDIDDFINTNHLIPYEGYKSRDLSCDMYEEWSNTLRTFGPKLRENTSINEKVIIKEYRAMTSTLLVQYCKFLQALFTEINLTVRENSDEDIFVVKPIPGYNCDVYIKTVGSYKPIFFFIVSQVDYFFKQQTVGVKYKEFGDRKYIVSEWSSIKLRDIENYLSINTTIVSSYSYLKQICTDENVISQHLNYLLILLLSNKDRDEEIITLLRYIYMRSISYTDNVTTLVSKLPDCLRSRLNVFQVKRTLNLMNKLHKSKPKIQIINEDRDIIGLCDIFGNEMDFKQALNFCYYGYIVNKSKQTESNQSSKLIDKILEYDLKVNDGKKLSGVDKFNLGDHYHDPKVLSVICHMAKLKIMQVYGDSFQKHFEDLFLSNLSKQNIISLSTIKASAKQNLPETLDGDSLKRLKSTRPKVTESLKNLIDSYGNLEHPIELVNYCIRKIDEDDSFNVELFSKDQHAGIREIYVVDIKVRVIQWFIELISRNLCRLFDSETMTNPVMKDYTSQKIVRNSMLKMENPIMLCRSGDASKWSQTQNVTKFYQVLKIFLPVKYHVIIKSILTLWFRKKIYLPVSLIELCLRNQEPLNNPTINFIQSIYSGERTDHRLRKNQPYLRIKTGFMQGILHFTSSFFHTIVQEGFLTFKTMLVKRLFPEVKANEDNFINVILQGSDDNSESIIIPSKIYKKARDFFKILVQIKDLMSEYVGIKVSKEKTASCTPFLMEYNSTWELAGKFVMPTIKFVFVSTDIPQKQTLIGRQEFYYSLLVNCLEKGCTLRTCCLIRLSQAEQHYLQLGYLHNLLFDDYLNLLRINKSPALGYFMFEPTVVCGLIGFDFMLYFHSIETSYTNYIKHEEKNVPVQILNNMGYKSIADYTVSKFHFKKYNDMMKSLNFDNLEDSKKRINERPECLYTTLNDKDLEFDLINLKMNDFSVKESLSSRFTKSEMFSSLIYILSRPVCFHNKVKKSLIKLSVELNNSMSNNILGRTEIKKSFTRSIQYDQLLDDIRPLINTNVLIDQTYIQRGSSRIKLLDGLNEESYKLMDLCKAKWFDIHVLPISKTLVNKYFSMAKNYIPWLRDTERETRDYLNCDSFQLYYYLLNSFKDSKYIKLLDTPGKKGSLKYLISRITDVNKKLNYVPSVREIDNSKLNVLRSNIKFVSDYPYSRNYKKKILKTLLNEYVKADLKHNEKEVVKMINRMLSDDYDLVQEGIFKNAEELNLVIFTKPQTFNQKDGRWTGEGIILAKHGSLIYELYLKDSSVVKIAVNRLELARNKFQVIQKTIKELNFKLLGVSNENIKLNASGILIDKIGTPVVEIRELSFNLANIKNLDVVIEHNRIKLVSRIKPKSITNKSLTDDFEEIEMVQVRGISEELEWIPKIKSRSNQKVFSTCRMKENEATLSITICSIKTSNFIFNHLDKPLFQLDDVASLFWSQDQSLDSFLIKLNNIINLKKINNYEQFAEEFNLDQNSKFLFRNQLICRGSSRDELVEKIVTVNMEEETEEWSFDDIFKGLNEEKIMSNLVDEALGSNLIDLLESIEIDLIDEMGIDLELDKFAYSLSQSSKGYYLHYSINDVFDSKLFDSLFLRLKIQADDIEELFESIELLNKYDPFMQNVIICLFGCRKNMISMENQDTCTKILDDSNDLFDILTDFDKTKELIKSINNNTSSIDLIVKMEDSENIINDNILSIEMELKNLKKIYSKQNSIPMKRKTQSRIEIIDNHLSNLIQLRDLFTKFSLEIKEKESKVIELINIPESPENIKFIQIDSDDDVKEIKEIDFEKELWEKVSRHIELNLIMYNEQKLKIMQGEEIPYKQDLYSLGDNCTFEMSNKYLIKKNLLPDNEEFIEIKVPGDGGCLFYSLMHSLLQYDSDFGIIYHTSLRKEIVELLNRFVELPEMAMSRNFRNEYPNKLMEKGIWGDCYCIVAFGILTNSIIYVRQNGVWSSCYGCSLEKVVHTLHLDYINNNHFNALIKECNQAEYEDNLYMVENMMGKFSF
nr:RNA-dependent RNA polymerase [Qingdao RNA virus 3]